MLYSVMMYSPHYCFRKGAVILYILIKINCLYRLAQVRETGLQERFRQHYITSNQPAADRSTTTVGLLTIAPILVVFVAGNIMSAFVLMIEQCIRKNVFKFWPEGNNRRPYDNEYRQLLRNRRHPRIHVKANRQPSRIR